MFLWWLDYWNLNCNFYVQGSIEEGIMAIQAKSFELSDEDQKRFEHKERHIKLHQNLEKLVADFVAHTGKLPSQTTLIELLSWSNKQTTNPT